MAKRLLFDGSMTLIPDIRNSTLFGLSIVGIGTPEGIRDPDGNLWVSDACAASLRYPEQQFQDAERENVSFLFFHIWLFTISVIAVRPSHAVHERAPDAQYVADHAREHPAHVRPRRAPAHCARPV